MTKWVFNQGDWCFYEFELHQISEVRGSNVVMVNDGFGSTSGRELVCFPLTIEIKNISDFTREKYNELLSIKGVRLNIPEIKQRLRNLWMCACEYLLQDNTTDISSYYKNIRLFVDQIVRVCNSETIEIDGINIFRRS